jgi:ABC-type ATPase involved in cell division
MSRNSEPAPTVRLATPGLELCGRVLREVDFTVGEGEAVFLAGDPGVGKSDFLDLLCLRSEAPADLMLFDEPAHRLSARDRARMRRRIGGFGGAWPLDPDLNAPDNLALDPLARGDAPRRARERMRELLAWVGFTAPWSTPAGDLAPPQLRRLGLARALMGAPRLLLADEPCAGLTPEEGVALLRMLAALPAGGMSLVIATRDLTLAARSGAPVYQLKDERMDRYQAAARA